ncbi:MAG: SIS domain-containing protein [Candidatus Paceibacterota bacterium]
MYESILNFNKQFEYNPEIVNQEKLIKKSGFVVVGMGGSALAAKLLRICKPELDITIHQDYGLPKIPKEILKSKLIILSSYSGSTEEIIDAFHKAKEENLDMAVMATGGKLLALAIENKISYVQLPDAGVQPRMALGLFMKAILKLMGEEAEVESLGTLATTLNPTEYEEYGKKLSVKIKNHVPVIYVSSSNLFLANIWKIKLNETGKIPAFYNVFPELNHNEMTGFDVADATKELSSKFYFLILKDGEDNPRILKRMATLEKLYKDRNLKIEIIEMEGKDKWYKIFSSLLLADFTSYYTALGYGLEPEQVPMVEEFKKLILE